MKLEISIQNVQHIKKMDFSVDLAGKSLVCITGKNGSGKTILIKAIKNLISADTFQKTSSARSISINSEIRYKIDGNEIVFKYDQDKKMLDSRDSVPNALRKKIFIELPIPHGERFNFFKKIGEIDSNLRAQIVLQRYTKPDELINFLESIYTTKKFENLVEVRIRNIPYYAITFDDNYYLREDFFSSGEYFLVSLYRQIISGHMAIFIDEIDISLDAAAQVRLMEWLRKFKEKFHTTFVFTTHSLAMMRMLEPDELFYMEKQDDDSLSIEKRSYAFIKSTLFGFNGWDKYILTEDDVLKDFIEYLISKHCKVSFYQHKIIYVGGGTNTTDLMRRNEVENFLTNDSKNVITVLDGDQRNFSHSKLDNVLCIPMESIEKELLYRCLLGQFWDTGKLKSLLDDYGRLLDFVNGENNSKKNGLKILLYKFILKIKKSTELRRNLSVANGEPAKDKDFKKAGKRLFKYLVKKDFTKQDIFEFLIKKNSNEMKAFSRKIEKFICLEVSQSDDNKIIE
ncbi:AAA family ATPase [Undibacterium sp. TJN25]|uniref:AAA family ATPase n=1 Tax=Undibacterium sp. TJN25 TaxID=3413056 RepID=UPI003BF39AC9